MDMLQIKGFLPDTAKNAEHPRAMQLKQLVETAAAENDSQLISFEVEDGIATFQVKGDNPTQVIIEQFKKLDGVDVKTLSAFEAQLQRNKAAQAKVDKMRENKKKRGQ